MMMLNIKEMQKTFQQLKVLWECGVYKVAGDPLGKCLINGI